MIELKRGATTVDQERLSSFVSKRQRVDLSMSSKVRKEKLSERIAALQLLVSPYGKTDTASVLLDAMNYIKFLHEQIQVLSAPYLYDTPVANIEEQGQYGLRSKGLCVVPISYTACLAGDNGADLWAPIKSTSPTSSALTSPIPLSPNFVSPFSKHGLNY